MISYDHLPLSKDIIDNLSLLSLNFVFQPIFMKDGTTIYAREALMRPSDKTVVELINEYIGLKKLHILEIATFFGAVQEYISRGYTERVAINSFPSECFTEEEDKVFDECFGDYEGKGIIELIEYPELSIPKWLIKKDTFERKNLAVSLDDYGSGINDMGKVDLLNPSIVELNRALISEIDKDEKKQETCKRLIEELHVKGKTVVAEGIETKQEFDILVMLGADLFQGYYLGRPA